MIGFEPTTRVLLCAGSTDMRKSFNGLAVVVRHHMQRDPLSGEAFVFCNRRRTLLKMLVWDGSGYWVHAKRLEKGTFSWPAGGAVAQSMTRAELALILGGLDVTHVKRRAWYRRDVASRCAAMT